MKKNWFIYLIICFCTGIIICVMATTYAEIMEGSGSLFDKISQLVGDQRDKESQTQKKWQAAQDADGGFGVQMTAESVSAGQAVLLNVKTGEALFGKNSHQRAYPASTTKIMTALVALDICREQGVSLDQEVVIPKAAIGVEGSSIYLKAGEKITIKDLMYGMMLRSGNDAATAVAATLGGSQENFIRLMNQRAKSLECENTNFVNPTGLFDDNHYTTAYDLSIISREAMKNKDFREIVSCKTWETSGTGESYRVFNNKNKTIFQYEGATGIKIGYTQCSGRTLVASSKRGNNQLICVVLNDSNWFNDAYMLMDYGYEVLEQ